MTQSSDSLKPLNILITGASGFLGASILKEILLPDSPIKPGSIRILDVNPPPAWVPDSVEVLTGDIRDQETVSKACREIDIVIHSAAIVDWGTHSEEEVYAINVTGTENILHACLNHGVSCLVYTSSLDAIYTGKAMTGIDESQPYPDTHPNMYCRSKRLAEEMVLQANGRTGGLADGRTGGQADWRTGGLADRQLKTCVIRPSDIWGPADPYHIGSLINMANGGFYVRLGNGQARCQHTYVGNVAYAHLLAAKALWEDKPGADKQVWFITDGPGTNFFTFFDRIIEEAGYRIRPKNLWIPPRIAFAIGTLNEWIARLIRPVYSYVPKFSRFAVSYTCQDFTFQTDKAERELGYRPKYTEEEALAETIRFYSRTKGTPAGGTGTAKRG